jgi:hypothetical protein
MQNEDPVCMMLTRNNKLNPSRQIILQEIENSDLFKVKIEEPFSRLRKKISSEEQNIAVKLIAELE